MGDLAKNDYDFKLSAIVLVYNGEKFLYECINSLVNQTLEGLEIILIDDASTDDSLYICSEFEKNYDNVRVIRKEKNGGLASSANLGIQEAKGEYIILVDNDDIIPKDAYKKLYDKAKETDSDVVIGKPNFLRGKYQYEMLAYEHSVWEEERTVNPIEFPKLFHDAFYWNKITRRDLLINNNIQLMLNAIYADRKFCHTIMTHAKKVSIIPDCVYLWRIRRHVIDESLSMRRKETWNYINRIDSYKSDLDYFTSFYKDYFKYLMRRVIVPVEGILYNKEFNDVYFDIARNLLIEELDKLEDPYDNDLKSIDNLLIYLTYHNYQKELKELLESNLSIQRDVYNDDETKKSYWNLHLFRNSKIDIPDFLFEINFMSNQFLSIEKISILESFIHFKNIKFPKYFNFDYGEVLLAGKTPVDDVLENNTLHIELDPVDSVENIYEAKIPIEDLANFEKYDVFLKIHNNDHLNTFMLNNYPIKEIENNFDHIKVYSTKNNNIKIFTQNFYNQINVELTDEQFKLNFKEDAIINKRLDIYLENSKTNELFKLDCDEESNQYSLKWKFFIDENSEYRITLIVYDEFGSLRKKIRLKNNFLTDLNTQSVKINKNMGVSLFKTKYDNINLISN